MNTKLQFVLFDWGDTLMSEAGPLDIPMADWPEVRTIDGAREVLAQLSKSYRIAVATNAAVSRKRDIVRALERVGLNAFITEIFCYTELGHKKDEPEFWEAVLARLGAHRSELVMIGDSLEQDVLGPMCVGIRAIWFNWKRESCTVPVSIQSVRSLREVPAVIGAVT
ncbi:MAG: HAD-IA family hydrolase [Verrucomicrobiia bacterium]